MSLCPTRSSPRGRRHTSLRFDPTREWRSTSTRGSSRARRWARSRGDRHSATFFTLKNGALAGNGPLRQGVISMTKRTRLLVAAAGMVLTFALITTAEGRPAAKSKSDSGTAYMSITHSTTKLEFAAGDNHDKILGS